MTSKLFFAAKVSWLLLGLTGVLLLGCNDYSPDEHRVEPGSAKKILEEVLTSWKSGGSIEDWPTHQPSVIVQDMDWKNGALLQDFEIIGDGEAVDANLHCQVKLKLQLPNKSKSEKTVTYLVGTSPVVTVFRALGP